MKLVRNILIGALALSAFTACDDDVDMPYKEAPSVYFEYEYQDPAWSSVHLVARDSVVAAMGRLAADVHDMEVKIPVKVLGSVLANDMTYQVEVVPTSMDGKVNTTAQEGVHYQALKDSYTFKAGVWVDTLRITVLRDALSTSYVKREPQSSVLRITEKGELKPGLRDGWEMVVRMNNFISEPTWWSVYGLGFYHPEKYKILLLFAEESFYASADLLNDSAARRCISAMRNYLNDNVIIDEATGKRVGFDSLIDMAEEEE